MTTTTIEETTTSVATTFAASTTVATTTTTSKENLTQPENASSSTIEASVQLSLADLSSSGTVSNDEETLKNIAKEKLYEIFSSNYAFNHRAWS